MVYQSKAFTLIELLVVLSIVSILVTLSIISYQAHVLKSYRREATVLLLYLANKQEQYYANMGFYSDNVERLGSDANILAPRYSLSIALSQQGHAYEIIAQATGTQLQDVNCSYLTVNHLGQRNSADGMSQLCWD